MKTLNIFKEGEIDRIYTVKVQNIIPLGLSIGKILLGDNQSIPLIQMNFKMILSESISIDDKLVLDDLGSDSFEMVALYIPSEISIENDNYISSMFKSHPYYVSDYISETISYFSPSENVFSTDMQFFVRGSSFIFIPTDDYDIGNMHIFAIDYNKDKPGVPPKVLDICLNNEQFIYLSMVHESIANIDETFDMVNEFDIDSSINKDMINGTIYPYLETDFIKIFETKQIIKFVPRGDNVYYINMVVQDQDRSTYNIHINMKLDAITNKDLKNLYKYIKKHPEYCELDVKEDQYIKVAQTTAYINGINYIEPIDNKIKTSSELLYESILENNTIDSSDIIFMLAKTNEEVPKANIFYFDFMARSSLMFEIKRYLINIGKQ